MESLKSVVGNVSETVFPGIKYTQRNKKFHAPMSGDDLASSLPLQMAVYFNIFYSPFWMAAHILTFTLKYSALPEVSRILLTVSLLLIIITEGPRLYLGYTGNLSESVPALAGFWLITLLIHLPLQCLLLHKTMIILPLERAVDAVMLIFIISEVIIGYFAIKSIAHRQALRFQMSIRSLRIANREQAS